MLIFDAVGKPLPQPRPGLNRKTGHRYAEADPVKCWKSSVRAAAAEAIGGDLADYPIAQVPVAVSLDFRFERPKSHRTKAGGLRRGAPSFHVSRPDADNLAKAVLDALGPWKAGDDALPALVWVEDSVVVQLAAYKRYAEPHEEPGVHAVIQVLTCLM